MVWWYLMVLIKISENLPANYKCIGKWKIGKNYYLFSRWQFKTLETLRMEVFQFFVKTSQCERCLSSHRVTCNVEHFFLCLGQLSHSFLSLDGSQHFLLCPFHIIKISKNSFHVKFFASVISSGKVSFVFFITTACLIYAGKFTLTKFLEWDM